MNLLIALPDLNLLRLTKPLVLFIGGLFFPSALIAIISHFVFDDEVIE